MPNDELFLPVNPTILSRPDMIVNTPQDNWWGLISTVTTDDGNETTISWPLTWPWSRTKITLKYKDDFDAVTLTQYDTRTWEEKWKIHLYSEQSILEFKRFLNEATQLNLEGLWRSKLVYSNLTIDDSNIETQIRSWYEQNPEHCKEMLTHIIGSQGIIQGRDIWNLVDRIHQVNILKRIIDDDPDVFNELRLLYNKTQKEKLIEEYFKDNSWILWLSLDSVQYNKIDDSLRDLERIQEDVEWRPEHNFDILTESTTVNIVELKLPETKLFQSWIDSHNNPKWNPAFFEYVTQIQNYRRVLQEVWDSRRVPNWKKIISPNTYLIIWKKSDMSPDQIKVFEMYRKNLIEPKIYTYDELLERAERITRSQPSNVENIESEELNQDPPF